MKSKYIHGKVVTNHVDVSEKLQFSIKEVQLWTDEGTETFLGGVRAYETTDLSDFTFESLICWNRKKNRVTQLPVNEEDLNHGKITVENWKTIVEQRWETRGRLQGFFVLKGFAEGQERNYILGGTDDCDKFFAKKNQQKYLMNGYLDACLTQKQIGENNWVYELVNGDAYIKWLENQQIVERVYLDVKKTEWTKDGMNIYPELENISLDEMKNCTQYLLADGTSNFCSHEKLKCLLNGQTILCFDSLKDKLRNLYEILGKSYRVNVYPVVCEGKRCIVYEFRNQKMEKSNNVYQKGNQYEVFDSVETGEQDKIVIMPYYTTNGYQRIVVKKEEDAFDEMYQAKVEKIYVKDGKLELKFSLGISEYQLKSVNLILRSQIQEKKYPFELEIKQKHDKWKVKASIEFEKIEWEQFYWDIWGIMEKDGKEYTLHLKNYSKWMKLKILLHPGQQYQLPGTEYVVYPYMTKSRDFALMYRLKGAQDNWKFVLKEYVALAIYYLLYPYWKSKNLWLVYEKYSVTAQDNSYYFFKYCMEQLPQKEKKHIFYVIDKNASDYQYVEKYGKKVIQFLSLKHMIYLKAAALLISSDTKAHAYAWHSPATLYRFLLSRKRNVFLQHGVIYYKQCHQGLKKSGTNNCKLFIVSSEVEKEIVAKNFGYGRNEIAVTGLARWDVLNNTAVPGEKLILMMPTWRSWLEEVTQEEFCKSDYYVNYMKLLNDPGLHEFLESRNVKLVFYIHPKFREYIGNFATTSKQIEMVEFGSKPLNELLMKCNMMITDYSSACWDVYYQEKPVLFYMFDYELYNAVQGSYVDMRTEAFGEATDDLNELITLMREYEATGFKEKEKYTKMRDELLPYRDHLNCERTYQQILKKFYWKKYSNQFLLNQEEDDEEVEDSNELPESEEASNEQMTE